VLNALLYDYLYLIINKTFYNSVKQCFMLLLAYAQNYLPLR